MSKIKIAEGNLDELRQALGKDLKVVTKGRASNIEPSSVASLRMSVVSRNIMTSGPLYQEETTIRLDPISATTTGFRSIVRNSIKTGVYYFDHNISLPKLDEPTMETKTESSKVMAMQDFETFFNYISDPYEETLRAIDEISLPPASAKPRKNQFMNFQDPSVQAPFQFIDTDVLKNMVVPKDFEINSSFNLNNFPYYNKIRLTTKVNNGFINFTKKINMFDDLLKGYLGSPKDTMSFNIYNSILADVNISKVK